MPHPNPSKKMVSRRTLTVELFFKWMKQDLRIKAFYGTSDNAVRTQIWIALSMYLLIALLRKHLKLTQSPYTILQILSIALFEKTPILQALSLAPDFSRMPNNENQLVLQGF